MNERDIIKMLLQGSVYDFFAKKDVTTTPSILTRTLNCISSYYQYRHGVYLSTSKIMLSEILTWQKSELAKVCNMGNACQKFIDDSLSIYGLRMGMTKIEVEQKSAQSNGYKYVVEKYGCTTCGYIDLEEATKDFEEQRKRHNDVKMYKVDDEGKIRLYEEYKYYG